MALRHSLLLSHQPLSCIDPDLCPLPHFDATSHEPVFTRCMHVRPIQRVAGLTLACVSVRDLVVHLCLRMAGSARCMKCYHGRYHLLDWHMIIIHHRSLYLLVIGICSKPIQTFSHIDQLECEIETHSHVLDFYRVREFPMSNIEQTAQRPFGYRR